MIEERENEANGSTAPYEADGRNERTKRNAEPARHKWRVLESPFTSNEEYYLGV